MRIQINSVLLADEYEQTWVDYCTDLVGEDAAQAAADMLASMVSAEIYGEEAVEAYKEGGMAYCCEFTQDLEIL